MTGRRKKKREEVALRQPVFMVFLVFVKGIFVLLSTKDTKGTKKRF